jgi:hypothetical protein
VGLNATAVIGEGEQEWVSSKPPVEYDMMQIINAELT